MSPALSVALVTGARVKIGYHAAILLLRNGCDVIVTTRFPKDAAARFGSEVDFADWGKRLSIWGLDLRHTPSVDAVARAEVETIENLFPGPWRPVVGVSPRGGTGPSDSVSFPPNNASTVPAASGRMGIRPNLGFIELKALYGR
jgi:NAD(P)-dependent dehydrogenase (short-subunit alcohol dehydrogenase family)